MAITKPRNKILLFRLTQEEYTQLQQASAGSRSLSEFARAKLLKSLGADPLDTTLSEMNMKLTRLASLIEGR
jgi:hypothetical protein